MQNKSKNLLKLCLFGLIIIFIMSCVHDEPNNPKTCPLTKTTKLIQSKHQRLKFRSVNIDWSNDSLLYQRVKSGDFILAHSNDEYYIHFITNINQNDSTFNNLIQTSDGVCWRLNYFDDIAYQEINHQNIDWSNNELASICLVSSFEGMNMTNEQIQIYAQQLRIECRRVMRNQMGTAINNVTSNLFGYNKRFLRSYGDSDDLTEPSTISSRDWVG